MKRIRIGRENKRRGKGKENERKLECKGRQRKEIRAEMGNYIQREVT